MQQDIKSANRRLSVFQDREGLDLKKYEWHYTVCLELRA